MKRQPTLPIPKAIRSLSPSRYTSLQSCVLREALSAGREAPFLPKHPKALLGTVAHKILELVAKGALQPQASELNGRWEDLCRAKEAILKESELERHFVPLRRSCQDYFLVRARTLKTAGEVGVSERSDKGGKRSLGPEIELTSPDGQVRGVIDLVHYVNGELVIKDYKTGCVLEDEGDGCVHPEYATQLKIYASLYHECFDRWPDKLVLLPLSGRAEKVEFSREECEHLIASARELLAAANARIARAASSQNPSELASPNPAACRFCSYRPACAPYEAARLANPEMDWPQDISGILEKKNLSSFGTYSIEVLINDSAERLYVRRLQGNGRHPHLESAEAGAKLRVFNLRREGSADSYAETPTTVMYTIDAMG